MAESYASAHVLRGLDDIKSDNVIISHAIHLPLLIYPNEEFVYDMSYLLIAKMYGRHIGIKGPLALQKLNISFLVPSVRNENRKGKKLNFRLVHLKTCVTFTATSAIFPPILLPPTCEPNLIGSTSSITSLLEWSKRTGVFDSNRCHGRTRIQTEFHVSPHLLPRLEKVDILLISSRLQFLVIILLLSDFLILFFGARSMSRSPINIRGRNVFSLCILPLNEVDKNAQEALNQLELRKKARLIQVSTEDSEVRAYLRQLGEPVCLFGEDGADRRERLRMILAVSGGPAQRPTLTDTVKSSTGTGISVNRFGENISTETVGDDTTVWYHQGPNTLAEARLWISEFSLTRAKVRLDRARNYFNNVPAPQRKAKLQEYHKVLRNTNLLCSQVGDIRPLSMCRFSPDGKQLATSSWSGLCRLWSIPDCNLVMNLRGHTAPTCAIVWHPQAGLQSEQQLALASSAQDGSVKLWSLDNEEPLADIEGHAPHRVSRLAFHPSGRFLATTCFDHSWRLWDLEACEEILHQEGHSKPVYDVVFHPDGSLALTTGLDGYARVWDLRTGRCIMFLEGHLEELLGADVADNGYHAATSSADNTVRIWDLRQQQAIYVIPAHTSVVSSVRFESRNCNYIVTSSFDKTTKIWGHPIWTPIKTLEGHNSKVVYADISPDNKYIATCSHDLTYKLWSRETN